MRRHFPLPPEDVEHLEAHGLSYETVVSQGAQWVLLHDFAVPSGYNHQQVTVGIWIQPGYPDAPLDMVYFLPALGRKDGKSINALSSHTFDGKQWQRWSRHRTGQNPWRPGVDGLWSHIELISDWLDREFRRN